jgi:gamma-glutamylcyclotransferase (GGCT)/AIG2-like uncharacterized protein YtfP
MAQYVAIAPGRDCDGFSKPIDNHAVPIRYFAYGSNMSAASMQDLSPGHRYLGVAELPNHRLAFTRRSVRTGTGVADILAIDGHSVWGALYELDDPHLAELDRKEGNGWAYTRTPVRVRLDGVRDGAERKAFAYAVILPEETEVAPSAEYLDGLLQAARERGLPEDYVATLACRFA